MNNVVEVAQARGNTSNTASSQQVEIVKVVKPLTDQALTLELGYGHKYKLDLSGSVNEKITLVHVGEKLVILFDNHATITIHPFFDSKDVPLDTLTVEVAPGR